ncbi:MAG: DEAD/DEAH box helicase [Candidatus Nanoarchaeia archaeon]|jgi:helicase|nr:DEAD/DEAH box helicase [Candidatus Nanoarchaeia archaeon]
MTSTSVMILKENFEDFLRSYGIYSEADELASNEIIYDLKTQNPTIFVRIYSSIDKFAGTSRSLGEDAIRCVLLDKKSSKPIDKAKRTHRMSNWKERLKEKLDEFKQEITNLKFCKSCGSVMVLREGIRGQFYGCLSYPNCKTSMSLTGHINIPKTITDPQENEPAVHCPECDAPMKKRNGRKGEFYGCTQFFVTGCTGTRQVRNVEIYAQGVEETDESEQMKIEFPKQNFIQKQEQSSIQLKTKKNIELVPTSNFPYLNFKFEFFNPVQSEVFAYYNQDVNCVVAAATSAGKTTVAEMFMSDSIAKGRKAIFLSPLKAVSQEKYEDWTNPNHGWSKLNVSIVTGDYQLTEKRVEELNNAHIIIMTTEMLDSRTRRIAIEKNNWLLEAGTIVQDESHLLCVKGRGDKAESAIMRFTKQNPSCRVIFLSATMPNVDELARWLSSLNGKKSELINSDYRPCQLDIHYEPYDDYGKYQSVEKNKMNKAIAVTQQFKEDKFIVFVHSKNMGRSIFTMLKDMGEKVELHNSELTLEDRVRIPNEFKDKNGIRIIVATSTLAWGINLPCRRCVVVGVHRGIQEVEPLDIKQMVGRSGRVGLDPKGDAHVLLPQNKFMRYKSWCENIPPILSTMNDQDVLAFHIISEISENNVYDISTLMDWYNRSLAAFQSNFLDRCDAENLLSKLERIKVIEKVGNNYKVTKLGRVAAYLYYSPYSISSWYFNFNRLFVENKLDDYAISWALANIPDNTDVFAGKEMQDLVKEFVASCRNRNLIISESCGTIGVAFYACLTFSEELGEHQKRQVKFDAERMCTALDMIDKMHAHWNRSDFWRKLQLRIEYEITDKQTELCSLRGIGGVRVRKLFEEGICTILDFKQKQLLARDILGEKLYEKVLIENRELLQ